MGVIIPVEVRETAGFEAGDSILLEVPRKGVITVCSIEDNNEDNKMHWHKLKERLNSEKSIHKSWPNDKSYKEVLMEDKSEDFGYEAIS